MDSHHLTIYQRGSVNQRPVFCNFYLEKKFASIKVIKEIVDAVKQSSHLLLNHLLAQLRTNIQLPTCLRIIGNWVKHFSEEEKLLLIKTGHDELRVPLVLLLALIKFENR